MGINNSGKTGKKHILWMLLFVALNIAVIAIQGISCQIPAGKLFSRRVWRILPACSSWLPGSHFSYGDPETIIHGEISGQKNDFSCGI